MNLLRLQVLDRDGKESVINFRPKTSDLMNDKGEDLINAYSYITESRWEYNPPPDAPKLYLTPQNYRNLKEAITPDVAVLSVTDRFWFPTDSERMIFTTSLADQILRTPELWTAPSIFAKIKLALQPILLQYEYPLNWEDKTPQYWLDLAFFITAVYIVLDKLVVGIG